VAARQTDGGESMNGHEGIWNARVTVSGVSEEESGNAGEVTDDDPGFGFGFCCGHSLFSAHSSPTQSPC
jgi:hypothetical protein